MTSSWNKLKGLSGIICHAQSMSSKHKWKTSKMNALRSLKASRLEMRANHTSRSLKAKLNKRLALCGLRMSGSLSISLKIISSKIFQSLKRR
jgi:hypothetical protein